MGCAPATPAGASRTLLTLVIHQNKFLSQKLDAFYGLSLRIAVALLRSS